MLPNMPAFPDEHRHGCNARTYLRCDVKQIGVDLAVIQNAIEKLPLLRCQIEQEGELFPAECNGLLDPRVDVSLAGEATARQTDRELLTELARVAFDGVDRHGPPVAPTAGAEGQNGGFDPVPVEPVDRQNTARIEEIAGSEAQSSELLSLMRTSYAVFCL